MSDLIWPVGHCQVMPDLDHVKLHRIQQNDEVYPEFDRESLIYWGSGIQFITFLQIYPIM